MKERTNEYEQTPYEIARQGGLEQRRGLLTMIGEFARGLYNTRVESTVLMATPVRQLPLPSSV